MNRPIMSMGMLTAPACKEPPMTDTTEPMNTVQRRPKACAKNMLKMVPRIAPPWKDETMPPTTVSEGLSKKSSNLGSAMVDVMIPESLFCCQLAVIPENHIRGSPSTQGILSSKTDVGIRDLFEKGCRLSYRIRNRNPPVPGRGRRRQLF